MFKGILGIIGIALWWTLTDMRANAVEPITPQDQPSWKIQRAELLAEWQKFLGEFPTERVPLNPVYGAVEELPAYTRRFVSYQIEPGVREDAVLIIPRSLPIKAAAVIVFHQTVKSHYGQPAGYDRAEPDLMMGAHLAERGYVVVCPRCFIFDDGADFLGNVAKMKARHANWRGMTRMTWDGIRAVDFVETLPSVDRTRIGVIGFSLGAKEALYVAAFDERVCAAVSCEGGVGMALSNWHDTWYLGPEIRAPGFARDHHELLALVAPRNFLLIAGGKADGVQSLPFLDAARPVFSILNAAANLRFFQHAGGHKYTPAAREAAEAFLKEKFAN